MSVHDYQADPVLEALSVSFSSVSVIALFTTLVIFFGLSNMQSERTTIGKHLCFCLTTGHVLVLTALDNTFIYKSDVST